MATKTTTRTTTEAPKPKRVKAGPPPKRSRKPVEHVIEKCPTLAAATRSFCKDEPIRFRAGGQDRELFGDMMIRADIGDTATVIIKGSEGNVYGCSFGRLEWDKQTGKVVGTYSHDPA